MGSRKYVHWDNPPDDTTSQSTIRANESGRHMYIGSPPDLFFGITKSPFSLLDSAGIPTPLHHNQPLV